MGVRLNQNKGSKRWRWLRDRAPAITSIISLPRDIFGSVDFHCEILLLDLQQNLWVNGLFRRDEGSDVQGRASLPDFATSMTATRGLIAAPWTSLASLCCRRKRHPLRSSSGQIRPPDSAIQ